MLASRDDRKHLSHFAIRIGGANAPRRVMDDLLDCTVDNSIHLPDVCAIRLHDAGFHWLDAGTFQEGVAIEIRGGEEGRPLLPLFYGEVTALEMDLAAHGVPTITIRCMDRSHRLHRGRHQRSFVQSKDSDIVGKIGREAGFSVKTDTTSQVHDWVFQNNQTNWEFLNERAARNGFRLFCKGERELHFRKLSDDGESVAVEWGGDLRSFRPRTSAAPQVDEVIVRGWDPKAKRAILGKCARGGGSPRVTGNDGKKAGSAFGAARFVVVDRPVHTQAEADDLARSLCDEIAASYLEAEGLCFGNPKILPGASVEIRNIGKRFSGKYFVTAATHTYTPAEGYTTLFAVSGKRPMTVLSLLQGGGAASGAEGGTGYGGGGGGSIVVAIVTDNKDPDELGRVKVMYPWLTEEHASFWARIAAPMAGAGRGFYFLPEVGDEVLVAFEHGDIRRPYLIGALWNGKDKPVEPNSKATKDGKVERRTIKTRIGHTVLLDDTDGKGEMSLTTKAINRLALDDKNQNITAKTTKSHLLVLDDKNQNITVKTTNGHTFVMDDRGKKVTLKTTAGHTVLLDDQGAKIRVVDKTGANTITIDSNSGAMDLKCQGNFSVEATGKVSIKGQAGVEVTTPAQMKLEGTQVTVTGKAQLNLEANGPATLKSSAITTVQGSLVKIN